MKKAVSLLALFIATILCNISYCYQDAFTRSPGYQLEERKLYLTGEIDVSFINDRRLHWTGTESTFRTQARLYIDYAFDERLAFRLAGRALQGIGYHARTYERLKYDGFTPEDTYIELDRFPVQGAYLQAGIVRVPFGIFDTFALEDINRPLVHKRSREWDSGVLVGYRGHGIDARAALVNGEGSDGVRLDTNSSKSGVARLGAYLQYEETRISAGLSGYYGNKYSTPIKERNSHWGVDLSLMLPRFAALAEFVSFNGKPVKVGDLDYYEFKDDITIGNNESDANGWYVQFKGEIIEDILELFYGFSSYDPAIDAEQEAWEKVKRRHTIGSRLVMLSYLELFLIYTSEDDPAFGLLKEESNTYKGDDKIQAALRLVF